MKGEEWNETREKRRKNLNDVIMGYYIIPYCIPYANVYIYFLSDYSSVCFFFCCYLFVMECREPKIATGRRREDDVVGGVDGRRSCEGDEERR